jgi:hypothetical protein
MTRGRFPAGLGDPEAQTARAFCAVLEQLGADWQRVATRCLLGGPPRSRLQVNHKQLLQRLDAPTEPSLYDPLLVAAWPYGWQLSES